MTQAGQQYTILDPSVGGEPRPSVNELAGRVVILIPKRIDETTVDQFSKVEPKPAKPTLYADLIVLDGGPLNFGSAPKASPPRPYATHVAQIPVEFLNVTFQHPNIVNSCRGAIGLGIVTGVIEQGVASDPRNNPPWNLGKLADGDPRKQLATQFAQAKMNGQWRPNQPQPLNAAPQQPVPSPYAQPQPQMTQPQFGQPQQIQPAAQGFAAAQQAPMQPQPQYGQPQAPWNPAAQQFAQPAPQAVPFDDAPVSGFEAIWPTLTPEMKQQVRAQAGQQQAPQGQPFNPYNQQ